MKIMLILVLALLAGAICYFLVARLLGEDPLPRRRPENSAQPVVNADISVAASSVIRIRHASDGLSIEMSGPEPFYGPLSDASLTDEAWDAVSDATLPREERIRCAARLREQGIRVRLDIEDCPVQDDVNPVTEPEAMDSEFFDSLAYESDDPEGDLVFEPLSDDQSAYIIGNLVSWLRSRRCSPAFAAEIARIHNILLDFSDEARRNEASDPDEISKVRRYDELIATDVEKAMDEFNRDYPPIDDGPEDVPAVNPSPPPSTSPSSAILVAYDWDRLR